MFPFRVVERFFAFRFEYNYWRRRRFAGYKIFLVFEETQQLTT
jgi:hypothetical protein